MPHLRPALLAAALAAALGPIAPAVGAPLLSASGIDGAAIPVYNVDAVTTAGDFDGDGRADIAIGESDISFVRVVFGAAGLPSVNVGAPSVPAQRIDTRLPGAAVGDFSAQTNLKVRALGDVNGDGRDDIGIVARGRAMVILGGPGTAPVVAADGGPRVLALRRHGVGFEDIAPAGDVDADGKDDYLVMVPDPSGGAPRETYLVRGGQASQDGVLVATRQRTQAVGDVTGDGRDDVAADDTLASVDPAAPSGIRVTTFRLGTAPLQRLGRAGDVDGDGIDDLRAFPSGTGNGVLVRGGASLARAGSVTVDPAAVRSLPAPVGGRFFEPVGDLNGDGLEDLASGVGYIFGRATGGWAPTDVQYATVPFGGPALSGRNGQLVPAGDLDADGRDDLLATGARWATQSLQPSGGLAPIGPSVSPDCPERGVVRVAAGETDQLAPRLLGCTKLGFRRTSFRVGLYNTYFGIGTRVAFGLDDAAQVRIAVRPVAGGAERVFTLAGKRGQNDIAWDGRIAGQRLAVGSYTVTATPVDAAGNAGPAVAGPTIRITG